MRREARAIVRAKVVLTAIAITAAVVLVAVSSWPLKALVVLAFVRGVFASDLTAIRGNAALKASEVRRASTTTLAGRSPENFPATPPRRRHASRIVAEAVLLTRKTNQSVVAEHQAVRFS